MLLPLCLLATKLVIKSLPTDPHGIRAELERIKAERLAKRVAQEDEERNQ